MTGRQVWGAGTSSIMWGAGHHLPVHVCLGVVDQSQADASGKQRFSSFGKNGSRLGSR